MVISLHHSGTILVQGKRIEDWSAHEFPVLLESVNILSKIEHFTAGSLQSKTNLSSRRRYTIFLSILSTLFLTMKSNLPTPPMILQRKRLQLQHTHSHISADCRAPYNYCNGLFSSHNRISIPGVAICAYDDQTNRIHVFSSFILFP